MSILRKINEDRPILVGVIMTLTLHAGALLLVSFSGLKYIYPPPEEQSILMDFSETEFITQELTGAEPHAEKVNLEKPVELAQKSESPIENASENLTPKTVQDDFGDVDAPSPVQEETPKLDPRAAFPGMSKKDTTLTATHSAAQSSNNFKEGQPKGNTASGRTDGRPNAHVKGRNLVGNIPRPVYNVQQSGTVVVNIWVDNYGNVSKAVPGGEGTTVTDKTLWAAARNAAMETHFNMDANASAMQEGTITYNFILK